MPRTYPDRAEVGVVDQPCERLVEEISDFACSEPMPGSGLPRGDLEGNLTESISVPGDVGANQLLDHLCGSHSGRISV